MEEKAEPFNFSALTPDFVLDSAEALSDKVFTGRIMQLNSYINRVFELETEIPPSLIAKFYRPGRWSSSSILEAHALVAECFQQELSVVAPLDLGGGSTLAKVEGINAAFFPKKSGRLFEVQEDKDWIRLGALIGRFHAVSSRKSFESREECHPGMVTENQLKSILDSKVIPHHLEESFFELCYKIIDRVSSLFEDIFFHRIHGDCHQGNILSRMEQGLLMIDFDDVMNGPAVQDLWLFLPDFPENSNHELSLLLDGYTQFHDFDMKSLNLIEALRFMRYIYFLNWMVFQHKDPGFLRQFPQWEQENFWEQEIMDIKIQYDRICEYCFL